MSWGGRSSSSQVLHGWVSKVVQHVTALIWVEAFLYMSQGSSSQRMFHLSLPWKLEVTITPALIIWFSLSISQLIMDPVIILSVAAASFQFAELAVKSFSKIAKITKDFEDVPKRMRDQLNDIETSITRLRDFSTDLTRDASASSLEPSRLGSLTSAVDNWLTTAADLESTLQGILNPSTASKRHKWQIAFKSLRQSDDIEWQIQRFQSLNHEIWRELLRTLLASQLQIKSDILDGETRISSNLSVAFQKLEDG